MRQLRVIEHIALDGVIQRSRDDDGLPYAGQAVLIVSPVLRGTGKRFLAGVNPIGMQMIRENRQHHDWLEDALGQSPLLCVAQVVDERGEGA